MSEIIQEKIYNLLGIRKRTLICCIDKQIVFIEPITEQQETRIDNSYKYFGAIRYEINKDVIIEAKDIYLYGELNFTKEEDVNALLKYNLIDDNNGFIIKSNFDYENGCFTTIDKVARQYHTWNVIDVIKYCHCLIGKPNRIIIYKLNKNMLKML